MPESIAPLPLAEFPFVIPSESWGRWWKVHSKDYGPWFYSSDDPTTRDPASIGRFDLTPPHGTLYVGDYLPGVTPESVRELGVTPAESQAAYNNRRVSVMPLVAYHGLLIADFTSKAVTRFGAPADVAALPRAEARPWARAAHAGGFAGIQYRLREDPKHRLGLALLCKAGQAEPPPGQQSPFELPVGLRNEMLALFDGEYRGDPIPR
jgi:RES domain